VSSNLTRLLSIMQRLRAPDGCAWDREQTFATIAPHTLEEAYEVADAVERADSKALCDELGDLLFQVVFQAEIAGEQGLFDFDAVAGAICAKLIRRHPHLVLEPAAPAADGVGMASPPRSAVEQVAAWEDIKAAERRERADARSSHLDDVPRTLPALMRAHKLSKRAARVGFDFDAAGAAADKVAEELAEVREVLDDRLVETAVHGGAGAGAGAGATAGTRAPAVEGTGAGAGAGAKAAAAPRQFEEVGDLLFAAVNLARKLDVDAEAALRAANAKFERRFRGMEALATARGTPLESLQLSAQERLWQEMKRGE
jgi:MazG family protein